MNKTLGLFLALGFSAVTALASEAPVQHAKIHRILSSQFMDMIGRPTTGTITVDVAHNELNVEFVTDLCNIPANESGMIHCAAESQTVSQFSTVLQSVEAGACDTVLYRGLATIAGRQVELVVSDNRLFYQRCKSIAPVPGTSGTLTLNSASGQQAKFSFLASDLE